MGKPSEENLAPSKGDVSRRELLGVVGVGAAAIAGVLPLATGKAFAAPASGLDLCYMNAADLAAGIRRKDLSAVEVMTAYLDRIEEVNPKVNAIVSMVDRDIAIGMANQADADLQAGKPIGPLHGLPWAIKDTDDAKGIATTFGSPIFKDSIAKDDALLTSRIRSAGALIIGKTNVPEFAAGSHTFNTVFGVTRNPHNLALTAGGSSGGAAVAVASGMLPMADGNDTGGSLRNPASWNNIVALRPSMGRVPVSFPLGWFLRLPAYGPMARTVGEAAYLLSVFAGPDPLDPISLPDDPGIFAKPLDRDFKGTRIAWTPDLGYLQVEKPVADATAKAIPILTSIGCVVENDHPDMTGAFETHKTLRGVLTATATEPFFVTERGLIKATMVWDVEGGRKLSALDVSHAEAQRAKIYHSVRKLLDKYEFLVLPVSQVAQFPVETEYPTEINGQKMRTYMEWMESCYAITLTGLPAISVPCAFTESGMPVGLQIVGRHNDDLAVLQLAHAFEKAAAVARPTVPKV
jgi:amidase